MAYTSFSKSGLRPNSLCFASLNKGLVASLSLCVGLYSGLYSGLAEAARASNGLQVLYEFNETSGNIINDTSAVGTPLNLTILNPSNVSLDGQRMDINNATRLETTQTNDKIYQAAKASNELTMEAWMMASTTDLYGPARIITHSIDGSARNFMLGQNASTFVVRLGTTDNTHYYSYYVDLNAAVVSTTNLQHVVVTRATNGDVKFYLNGSLAESWNWSGNLSSWVSSRKLAIGNEYNYSDASSRDWLGELHLVALYSRALTAQEVSDNYSAGANPSGPSISYSGANPVDFGTTSAGSTVQRTIAIDNSGTAPLDITSLQISGVNASDYAVVSDSCVSGTVSVSGSCTITIEFSP